MRGSANSLSRRKLALGCLVTVGLPCVVLFIIAVIYFSQPGVRANMNATATARSVTQAPALTLTAEARPAADATRTAIVQATMDARTLADASRAETTRAAEVTRTAAAQATAEAGRADATRAAQLTRTAGTVATAESRTAPARAAQTLTAMSATVSIINATRTADAVVVIAQATGTPAAAPIAVSTTAPLLTATVAVPEVQAYVDYINPRLDAIKVSLEDYQALTNRLPADPSLVTNPAWRRQMDSVLSRWTILGAELQAYPSVPPDAQPLNRTLVSMGRDLVLAADDMQRGLNNADIARINRATRRLNEFDGKRDQAVQEIVSLVRRRAGASP